MSLLQGTMIPIYTVTVGAGGQAAIQFNNIPQTYTDLIVKLSVRTNRSGTYEGGIGIGINSNESTGYTWKTIEAQGTSVTSNNTSYEPDWVSRVPASQTTSSIFSNIDIYIPNYTSSTAKSYLSDGVGENNSTTGSLTLLTGLQSSTSAITSLRIADKANGLIVQHSTATLYGVSKYTGETGGKATGGVVTSDANYWYHTFKTSGHFVPNQSISADVLVVGGGGSGGADSGGGGGAGGFRTSTGLSLTATSYLVSIGAGGAGATSGGVGSSGGNSIFSTITSSGGGRGGDRASNYPNGTAGANGGSGGGGGGSEQPAGRSAGTGNSGSYSPAEGNNGGAGTGPAGNFAGGGGGGAGAAGTAAAGGTTNGGNGGIGSYNAISGGATTGNGVLSGGNYYFAGGGGGGGYGSTASGGTGGGGAGSTVDISGNNGLVATGGGGGGAGNSSNSKYGGNGGSGIVIIRYAK